MQQLRTGRQVAVAQEFQSPFHRVKGCNSGVGALVLVDHDGFNPLFIGSKDATESMSVDELIKVCFNPLLIGSKDATDDGGS